MMSAKGYDFNMQKQDTHHKAVLGQVRSPVQNSGQNSAQNSHQEQAFGLLKAAFGHAAFMLRCDKPADE